MSQAAPQSNPAEPAEPFVYEEPVAICTLGDEALQARLGQIPELQKHKLIIAPLFTENLGIEQMIEFCLNTPHLRFIILCGTDPKQALGYLPGQSMLALNANGLADNGRIIGAEGKRPFICNISREGVGHFRRTVTLIDMIGCTDADRIVQTVERCYQTNPGPAERFEGDYKVQPDVLACYVPEKMVTDPAGYFVISLDRTKQTIVVQHFDNRGTYKTRLEGKNATELYFPAIEHGLVTLLDHAAYLGRELQRAELALQTGRDFVQDDPAAFSPH